MKINAIKMLQMSAAALVLSAFAYGGVSAAEKKKEAAQATAGLQLAQGREGMRGARRLHLGCRRDGQEDRQGEAARLLPRQAEALPRRRPEQAPRSDAFAC